MAMVPWNKNKKLSAEIREHMSAEQKLRYLTRPEPNKNKRLGKNGSKTLLNGLIFRNT